jgi:hypothetical protein
VPERAVKGELPTPEQEKAGILAFVAFTILAIVGTGTVLFLTAVGIGKLAQWVFGW